MKLFELVREQFPELDTTALSSDMGVGSFQEWDSLGHFNLLLLVEERYDTRFSADEMSEMKNLKDIIKVLKSKGIKL